MTRTSRIDVDVGTAIRVRQHVAVLNLEHGDRIAVHDLLRALMPYDARDVMQVINDGVARGWWRWGPTGTIEVAADPLPPGASGAPDGAGAWCQVNADVG
ncbi:hypothetical protein [Plastoroseomonas hellenica]|uniref:hypothetical protein n=1 Tax=Plastoroseomonas hellenica TaxID=2687306 RepID=UPI001BA56DF8|nr:hypothetical protein [Plastoroseomonas hellenica]MBR0641479.1 hypothetical protein [Plastoroseomonas hellenica]